MLTALDIFNNFEQEKYKQLDDPPWKLPTLSIDLEPTQHEQAHPLAIRNRCLDYIEKYKYHVRIYTDGSKSDSGCGCAMFVENDKTTRTISLPKTSSALSAELIAILQSLHWARDNNKNKLAIFSDSLSGLQAIKNGKLDNSIVNDILLIHKVLATNGYRITFIWIPAHVGVPGNEHADRLAKRAATKYDEALQLPLSSGEAKRQIYLFVQKEWENEYAASVNGSLYKTL